MTISQDAHLPTSRVSSLDYRSYTLYPLLLDVIEPSDVRRDCAALIGALTRDLAQKAGVAAREGDFAEILHSIRHIDLTASADIERAVLQSFVPVTKIADEGCFIRILQICEVSFFAVSSIADQAVSNSATNLCAALQDVGVFQRVATAATRLVMRFVTSDGFKAFTQTTGNISAIESHNYALCEAHLCEVTEQRLASLLFSKHPDVVKIIRSERTLFHSIKSGPADRPVLDALSQAQKELQNWKKIHLAAMVKTLGPESVDKNVVSYLRQFQNTSEIAADKNIDNKESTLEILC